MPEPTSAISPIVSEAEAWELAHRFAGDSRDILGAHFVAAVVVGSLGAGRYVPGRSDVDLIVVSEDTCLDSTLGEVTRLARRYWRESRLRKGFGGYAIRRKDLSPPYGSLTNEAFEILQLKRQGQVVAGNLDLKAIPEPSHQDMFRSLQDFVSDLYGAWSLTFEPPIDPRDARANTILYWLRFLIWDRTENYVLSKYDVFPALDTLPEALQLGPRLEPIRSYVFHGTALPDSIDEVCRDVEAFMITRLPWVAAAAHKIAQSGPISPEQVAP